MIVAIELDRKAILRNPQRINKLNCSHHGVFRMNYQRDLVLIVTTFVLLEFGLSWSHGEATKSLSDLTGDWQLFVDDYLVARKANVVRTYHPFEKHPENPIMVPDKPWMDHVVTAGVVLPNEDGKGYRMWHGCWVTADVRKKLGGSPALYSTSKDGIHWEMPILGLVPWIDGSLENNFLPTRAHPVHTPFNADPKRRYTSMARGKGGGYSPSFSADGIHWETPTDTSPLVGGSDVGNFHHDVGTGLYRGYVKVVRNVSGLRRRCVALSATKDLRFWPPPELVMAPDDFDDRWIEPDTIQRTHFYGCPVIAYETMYLGLLWIFRAEDDRGYFHGPAFCELVTSRDGEHWLREEGDRPPILANGPTPSWDQGMIFTSAVLVEGDTIKVYYTGSPDHHDVFPIHGAVGLAMLRKDGFASLDSGTAVAQVMTKSLKNAAGPLHVNYDGSRTGIGGYLEVEVLDADARVIPGYSKQACDPLGGNSVDEVVTWGERTELPAGVGPIRLNFLMKNTSLYSFMAGDNLEVINEPAEPILAALYTFEKDTGKSATDILEADGQQAVFFRGIAAVDSEPDAAAFGKRSLSISSPFRPLNRLEIEGTSQLGTHFTLAAMVKSGDNKLARLFSTYDSSGPVNYSELVFDFDPQGKVIAGLRLMCKGIVIESNPITFADNAYHHLAVTYNDGLVHFYLDGSQVGRQRLPGGEPVVLTQNLLVGEDEKLGLHEQLTGHVDDLLVLGRALKADEVKTLSTKGAEVFFAVD